MDSFSSGAPRSNARQKIFRTDANRLRFVENLSHAVATHGMRVYLWVLMPNHLHILLETSHGNLSTFMQWLLTAYTVYFHRQYNSVGHLFQSRFKACIEQGDEYLLKLSRDIHLNPVRCDKALTGAAEVECTGRPAGQRGLSLREQLRLLRGYRWSSYPSYIGLMPPCAFVDYAPILALVGGWVGAEVWPAEGQVAVAVAGDRTDDRAVGLARLRRAYRRFVETALAHSDEVFRRLYAAADLAIGDEGFVRQMEPRAVWQALEAHGGTLLLCARMAYDWNRGVCWPLLRNISGCRSPIWRNGGDSPWHARRLHGCCGNR